MDDLVNLSVAFFFELASYLMENVDGNLCSPFDNLCILGSQEFRFEDDAPIWKDLTRLYYLEGLLVINKTYIQLFIF